MAKKLLIVEEARLTRYLVRQAAATPDDRVWECGSPAEAVKLAGRHQPDCVVMGVTQAVPEAFHAIRNIRGNYPQVRIVALSQFHEPRLEKLATEAGATHYVAVENITELFTVAAPEPQPDEAAPRARRRKK